MSLCRFCFLCKQSPCCFRCTAPRRPKDQHRPLARICQCRHRLILVPRTTLMLDLLLCSHLGTELYSHYSSVSTLGCPHLVDGMASRMQIHINSPGCSKCKSLKLQFYRHTMIKTPRLLVLSAQSCYVPATFSLTTPSPEPTAGEAAIRDLLRLIRNPRPDTRHSRFKGTFSKPSTFLSGALPRDRRGKVPHKGRDLPDFVRARLDEETLGEETPRIGPPNFMLEIVREREFLEALRCVTSRLITSVHCSY